MTSKLKLQCQRMEDQALNSFVTRAMRNNDWAALLQVIRGQLGSSECLDEISWGRIRVIALKKRNRSHYSYQWRANGWYMFVCWYVWQSRHSDSLALMYLLQDDYDRALYFTGYFEQSFLVVGDLKLCLIYLFNFCVVPEKSLRWQVSLSVELAW